MAPMLVQDRRAGGSSGGGICAGYYGCTGLLLLFGLFVLRAEKVNTILSLWESKDNTARCFGFQHLQGVEERTLPVETSEGDGAGVHNTRSDRSIPTPRRPSERTRRPQFIAPTERPPLGNGPPLHRMAISSLV